MLWKKLASRRLSASRSANSIPHCRAGDHPADNDAPGRRPAGWQSASWQSAAWQSAAWQSAAWQSAAWQSAGWRSAASNTRPRQDK